MAKSALQLLSELRDAVWDNLNQPTEAETIALMKVMSEATAFLYDVDEIE